MTRYEHRKHKLASTKVFYTRVFKNVLWCFALLFISLFIGVLGYHWIGELSWIDSLLNASMILGGMGPVDPLQSDAAKIFASFYAIYSGVAFLGAFALIMTPLYHRFLHKFHLEEESES